MTQVHKVGPFLIGNKKLGEGATGKVYLSFHEESNAKVAIKVIDKAAIIKEQDKKRKIEQELAILKVLNHPHIIDYYASYETSRYLFVVQELLSGGELFDYVLKKKKLSSNESIKFLLQITSALRYIHSWKICHRDVKLENVLLTHDKRTAKLCDFGMATYTGGNKLLDSCGSPFYAAPELFREDPYDGCKADIWSLGICFFVMLYGIMPFGGNTDWEIVENVTKGKYIIPHEISPSVDYCLRGMLSCHVSKRISLRTVQKELEPFKTLNPIALRPKHFDSKMINDTNDINDVNDEDIFLSNQHPITPTQIPPNHTPLQTRNDINSIAGEPLIDIDDNILQLLVYLLFPLKPSIIRKELFDEKPTISRAFYKAIVDHTQNVMNNFSNGYVDDQFLKSSVSPAFNEFLRKKQSCSPTNVNYHEESSPIPDFSLPKEIPMGLTLTDTSTMRQITVEMNPFEVVDNMNIVMKDLGILNEQHIDIGQSIEMTYKCDGDNLIFTICIDNIESIHYIDSNTIIKYELVKGDLSMFNDVWNVIKRQLFELDEFSSY
ncbi:non-specific serine/threonine protein kinase [Entamoeba marina]